MHFLFSIRVETLTALFPLRLDRTRSGRLVHRIIMISRMFVMAKQVRAPLVTNRSAGVRAAQGAFVFAFLKGLVNAALHADGLLSADFVFCLVAFIDFLFVFFAERNCILEVDLEMTTRQLLRADFVFFSRDAKLRHDDVILRGK